MPGLGPGIHEFNSRIIIHYVGKKLVDPRAKLGGDR